MSYKTFFAQNSPGWKKYPVFRFNTYIFFKSNISQFQMGFLLGFLKSKFESKCNWHYLNLLSISKRSHKSVYCLSLNQDSLSESANYREKSDLEAKSWLESYRSKHQSHVVTAMPSECRLKGCKTNSTLNDSSLSFISLYFPLDTILPKIGSSLELNLWNDCSKIKYG